MKVVVSSTSAPRGRCDRVPELHPAGPDRLAELVVAGRLGGGHRDVHLHLHQQPLGILGDDFAVRVRHGVQGLLALQPLGGLREGLRVRVHAVRGRAARKIAFLPGKSRKRYGCETPTRLAIASVDVP